MIFPTKYMDLQTSVVRLAAFILEETSREPILRLSELSFRVEEFAGEFARFNFFPALNVLYLAGKIDYSEQGDFVVSLSALTTESA